MTVFVEFFSILSDWFGTGAINVELPAGATYGDLLDHIRHGQGSPTPAQIWDEAKGCFSGRILATRNGCPIKERGVMLQDRDRVKFWPMMAGG